MNRSALVEGTEAMFLCDTRVQSTILVPNRWVSHGVNGVNGELIRNR
jgi:hypothetical protein